MDESNATGEQVTLGELIRRKRRSMAPPMNQQQVSELFGVNQSTVAKWERGDPVGVDRLPALADWLGLSFEEAFHASRRRPAGGRHAAVDGELERLHARIDELHEVIAELQAHQRPIRAQKPATNGQAATKKKAAGKATPAAKRSR